ncbi:MAG: hypothetical protein EOO01_38075 [Chitinophagaceae bacterium]|nr:MAG: hypothetical protein EOO01_38075 [Chitinophagaceae bacterium]
MKGTIPVTLILLLAFTIGACHSDGKKEKEDALLIAQQRIMHEADSAVAARTPKGQNVGSTLDNFVSNFNMVKEDGGGIYTWNGNPNSPEKGSKVLNNIVLNGVGAESGTPKTTDLFTHGIYLDDNTSYVEVKGNAVAFCNGSGIFLHNANHIDVSGNTLFSNEWQLFMQQNGTHQIRANFIN